MLLLTQSMSQVLDSILCVFTGFTLFTFKTTVKSRFKQNVENGKIVQTCCKSEARGGTKRKDQRTGETQAAFINLIIQQ